MLARRPTQKDVAIRAGLSQATVSMVLSGGEAVSIPTETIDRIRNIAKELGYTPNRFAQALKTKRTMTIACIVPDITNPFYPGLIRGVQKIVQDKGYDVITVNTDGNAEREQHFLNWALQGRVDGVIGVFFTLRAPDLAVLTQAEISVVRVESSKKNGGAIPVDDIYVDSRAAAKAVTSYLLSKGHKRIAMIAGNGGPQGVRVEGYREVLENEGFQAHVVIDELFNEEGGFRATEKIFASGFAPTAIFAANDLMAIGAMQALRECGIHIPDTVAVVGFDDISAAKLVTPSLSTVSQFQDKMGEKAAEILLDRLSGARTGDGSTHEMPFLLIKRNSA